MQLASFSQLSSIIRSSDHPIIRLLASTSQIALVIERIIVHTGHQDGHH